MQLALGPKTHRQVTWHQHVRNARAREGRGDKTQEGLVVGGVLGGVDPRAAQHARVEGEGRELLHGDVQRKVVLGVLRRLAEGAVDDVGLAPVLPRHAEDLLRRVRHAQFQAAEKGQERGHETLGTITPLVLLVRGQHLPHKAQQLGGVDARQSRIARRSPAVFTERRQQFGPDGIVAAADLREPPLPAAVPRGQLLHGGQVLGFPDQVEDTREGPDGKRWLQNVSPWQRDGVLVEGEPSRVCAVVEGVDEEADAAVGPEPDDLVKPLRRA
mmetsp:Transcript_126701/g.370224  ORF Transcript_126701/g.370224 Transcript_126701/m.370224 type:complete len:271 (-) Transcript_126701:233-1045(-)